MDHCSRQCRPPSRRSDCENAAAQSVDLVDDVRVDNSAHPATWAGGSGQSSDRARPVFEGRLVVLHDGHLSHGTPFQDLRLGTLPWLFALCARPAVDLQPRCRPSAARGRSTADHGSRNGSGSGQSFLPRASRPPHRLVLIQRGTGNWRISTEGSADMSAVNQLEREIRNGRMALRPGEYQRKAEQFGRSRMLSGDQALAARIDRARAHAGTTRTLTQTPRSTTTQVGRHRTASGSTSSGAPRTSSSRWSSS
jgi:hypothetical protein